MKIMILCLVLGLVSCASEPPKLSAPDKNAQTWNLNPGHWSAADIHQGGINAGR